MSARALLVTLLLMALLIGSMPRSALAETRPEPDRPGSSPASASPQPASRQSIPRPPATSATWTGPDELTITSRLELFGAGLSPSPKAAERKVRHWIEGAQARWNQAPPALLTGPDGARLLELRFRFEWRLRDASARATPGYHQIEVVSQWAEYQAWRRGRPGKLWDGYRSWTWRGGRARGLSACFGSLIWPTVVAHELGHLLGLVDEYDSQSRPLPLLWRALTGQRSSLMDLSWAPWARILPVHVAGIYREAEQRGWITSFPSPPDARSPAPARSGCCAPRPAPAPMPPPSPPGPE